MLMRSSQFGTMTSSRNILLQTLDRSDRELLEPHFEEIELKRGEVLIQPDEALDFVYFPNSGIFSVEECIGRRRHIEIAVVGHEGLLGWPALLGCARSCHSAVVQGHDGSALRIGVRSFLQTIILQMARAIASHLDHSLDQNLARWLLMRHDRVDGDELHVRHEEIADAIGVRRASITDTMHVLEGDHLVRCNRGRLVIRDRRELERVAGEAYGHAERQYRTMIAPFGKLPADFSLS